jgi:hypothetical protein
MRKDLAHWGLVRHAGGGGEYMKIIFALQIMLTSEATLT